MVVVKSTNYHLFTSSDVHFFTDGNKHTYTHTYIHTHIHTLMHTHTQARKSSLGSDSPLHSSASRIPTSPLVVTSSSQPNRRDSNHSLPGTGCGPQPPSVPKVNVSFNDDQPLDRQGIINITVDVQNFLANISRLRKAMEEADASEEGMSVCLSVCLSVRLKLH